MFSYVLECTAAVAKREKNKTKEKPKIEHVQRMMYVGVCQIPLINNLKHSFLHSHSGSQGPIELWNKDGELEDCAHH